MPEHQQLLVTGPGPGGHQRLETRVQPSPAALIAGLPTARPLRCHLYPPMNDSRSPLMCPRCFEPWLCELRDRIGGCPERFELCWADVTEVAVTAFDVVEVVDVIGDCRG